MPDPVESLYVEILARADQLIAEAQRARDEAKKSLQQIDEAAKKTEGSFSALGAVIAGAVGGIAATAAQRLLDVLVRMVTFFPNLVKQGIALNASMESVELTFNRLLGSEEKAAEFLEAIRKEAQITGQSVSQMAFSAKQFLPYAEGSKQAFIDMMHAAQGLAAADPLQGMMGAAFALREFLSGSYLSLAQRFELPRKALAGIIKDHSDIESRMQALLALLEQYGMGFGLVSDQVNTFGGRMAYARGLWQEMLEEFGRPIFEDANSALADMVDWLKENREELVDFARKAGEFVSNLVGGLREKVIPAIVDVGKAFDNLFTRMNRGNEEWGKSAWKTFREFGFLFFKLVFTPVEEAFVRITQLVFATHVAVENLQALWRREEPPVSLEQFRQGLEDIEGQIRELTRERVYKRVLRYLGFEEIPEVPEPEVPPPVVEAPPPEERPFELGDKAQKALAQGARKIEQIFQRFQKRIEKLRQDHTKKMFDIDERERKDTEKALAKHQRDVEKLRSDHYKTQIRNQEDFNKQWRRLIRDQHQEVLDADWEFQFEEERLIAEGDTLALRELRERYKHEQEIRAREQEEARSDAQEDFRQQQDEREQDFRERLLALQTALNEQLMLIAQNAEEARQKERENLAQRELEAQQSRDEELTRIGEWLANVKGVNEDELNEIRRIWIEVYGDIANKAIEEGIRAHQERMRMLGLEKQEALALAAVYDQIAARGAERAIPGALAPGGYGYTGPVRPPQRRRYAQAGLDEIFTRPTSIIVGEGGMPEHVRVTPLTGGLGGGISGRLDVNVTVSSAGALSPEAESNMIIAVAGALESAVKARETR